MCTAKQNTLDILNTAHSLGTKVNMEYRLPSHNLSWTIPATGPSESFQRSNCAAVSKDAGMRDALVIQNTAPPTQPKSNRKIY